MVDNMNRLHNNRLYSSYDYEFLFWFSKPVRLAINQFGSNLNCALFMCFSLDLLTEQNDM